MKSKKLIVSAMLLYGFDGVLFLTTDPRRLPLAILVLPFAVFFVASLLLILAALFHFKGKGGAKAAQHATLKAVLVVSFVTLCLLLQSIGQLSVRDLAILLLIFGVVGFYLRRAELL